MWGSAGTGKTLILMEALKIKLSKLLSQGRRVRILATGFDDYITTELMNNFTTKYLVNMKNIEVMGFEKLCSELHIKYDQGNPLDTLNKVITSLSLKHPHIFTLLLGKGSLNSPYLAKVWTSPQRGEEGILIPPFLALFVLFRAYYNLTNLDKTSPEKA